MIRLSPEEQKTLERVRRQFPEFVEILSRWRTEELERLPNAVGAASNVNVMQGRVQALTEMQRAIQGRVD